MSRRWSSFTPEFKDKMVKLYLEQRSQRSLQESGRLQGIAQCVQAR
jgi:transposase-like protein